MAATAASIFRRIAAFFEATASLIDRARFLFIPLAMAALVAVGAHAAADALGDFFLEWIDRAQGAFDSLVSRWTLTAGLVELIGLARRTQIARVSGLLFELAADALLAWPMLGFDETPGLVDRARILASSAWEDPKLIAFTRTIFAASISFAGALSVARSVDGAIALQLRPLLGRSGLGLPHLFGLVALFWITCAVASRATLRALEQAEEKAQRAKTARERILFGLTGSLILAPLALMAASRAMPFASFFR